MKTRVKIGYNKDMKKNLDYTIIFCDDDIVVLNKRSGLLVAADRYDSDAPRLDKKAEEEFGRVFAVHRIDKDTSGLVVYARNAEAHKNICEQFEQRQVKKTYHCLVHGRPSWGALHVDTPLLVDGDARHRTIVSRRNGKPSVTDFYFLGACGPYSWIEARPKTGRTHQIRAHLQDKGFSIVCDPLYSGNQRAVYLSEIKRKWNGDEFEERPLLNRLALHAYKINFMHPRTNETVEFVAPYPRDLEAVRKQFEKIFKVNPLYEKPEA